MTARKAMALALALAMALVLLSACAGARTVGADGAGGPGAAGAASNAAVSQEAGAPAEEPAEEPISVSIVCAGDVMVHEPQLVAQFDSETKAYDFRNNFQYVKDYVSAADLALCNLETTLGGSPYTGYPMFSSPESLAGALADAGFDAVFTSNNHMLDRGADGVRRTIEAVRAAGLKNSGSQYEGEDNFLIISVGAIQAGVVSYTYESPRIDNVRTLNGLRITDELLPMVNSFGYEDLEGDLGEVEAAVRSARAAGADIVICYFHWGNEYQRAPDDSQRRIAARAAAAGADIIFASHPHVLQAVEAIDAGNGREVPVFYSMGNFISNQREETTGSMYTEQGMLAMVELGYMVGSREIVSVDAGLTPTWLDKYSRGGKNVYAIVPLDGGYKENEALLESGHVDRAAAALEYCEALFGAERLRGQRGGEMDGARGQGQGAGGDDGTQQQQQQQQQQ